jgi:hypothetical protein
MMLMSSSRTCQKRRSILTYNSVGSPLNAVRAWRFKTKIADACLEIQNFFGTEIIYCRGLDHNGHNSIIDSGRNELLSGTLFFALHFQRIIFRVL